MRRSALFLAVVGMLLMGVASTDVVDAAEPETATLTIVKEITAESVDYLGSSSPRSFHFNIPGFYPDQPIYTDLYFRITPSFGETENGTQVFAVDPGGYTIQEVLHDDNGLGGGSGDHWWPTDLECSALAGSPTFSVDVEAAHPDGYGKITLRPNMSGADVVGAYADVTVAAGDNVQCVFTNDLVWWNKLGFKKTIDGWEANDPEYQFTLDIDTPSGPAYPWSLYPTPTDRIPGRSTATPHGTYKVTEEPKPGFRFVGASCMDVTTGSEWVDYEVDRPSATVTVTLAESTYDSFDDVLCTFFSEYVVEELAVLTLIEDAVPNSDQPFEFWLYHEDTNTPIGSEYYLVDNATGPESKTFYLEPGRYGFGQFSDATGGPTVPADWEVTSIICTPDAGESARSPEFMREAVLSAGEVMTCTFTHTSTATPDSDGDGVFDDVDNCIDSPNPLQGDFDGDGVGDACDQDIDGDTVANGKDICAETTLPDAFEPRKNRYGADANGDFVDVRGRMANVTVSDTYGCSGEQIADVVGRESHKRSGPTKSMLLGWIADNA